MIEVKALSLMEAKDRLLSEMKDRLLAERDLYELCSFIDHYPDVVRCRKRHQSEIDRLKREIAELEVREPRR
jgi:hypothetical protein